jgi:hypothetical protein
LAFEHEGWGISLALMCPSFRGVKIIDRTAHHGADFCGLRLVSPSATTFGGASVVVRAWGCPTKRFPRLAGQRISHP